MARQAHWQHVYTSKAEGEVSWFQDIPAVSVDLIGTVAGPGSAVVDIGGGASRLVDRLIADGYCVTVVDIAEAGLATARTRIGKAAQEVDWVVADVTRWRPQRSFDVWHDRAAFHFLVDAAERQAYAEVMAAAVRIGGYAVVGTFAADGPQRCSGLPVCRYDASGLEAQFREHFQRVTDLRHDHVTPSGAVQPFQFCVFKKVR